MRVAIYARVSKEEEGMQNPDNQLMPLRKYCMAMNHEIVKEYVDRCSGGNSNRPQFQEMLKEVRQGHYNLILVWSLDRFSREGITNTMSYIKQLKNYNTHLISYQESWLDTRNEGIVDLMLSIMSYFAADERKKISERTKAGLARKRAEGVKLGRPKKAPAVSL